MTKKDILRHVVNCHNRVASILVQGDNAIMTGETLRELRMLAQALQTDITEEQKAEEQCRIASEAE